MTESFVAIGSRRHQYLLKMDGSLTAAELQAEFDWTEKQLKGAMSRTRDYKGIKFVSDAEGRIRAVYPEGKTLHDFLLPWSEIGKRAQKAAKMRAAAERQAELRQTDLRMAERYTGLQARVFAAAE